MPVRADTYIHKARQHAGISIPFMGDAHATRNEWAGACRRSSGCSVARTTRPPGMARAVHTSADDRTKEHSRG